MSGGKEYFDSIDEGASAVGDCAIELSDQLIELQGTVTSESPWGEDEAGTLFGMAYTAVLNHALEAISSHVDLLVEGYEKMAIWGESSRANEDANEQDADRIDPDVVEV